MPTAIAGGDQGIPAQFSLALRKPKVEDRAAGHGDEHQPRLPLWHEMLLRGRTGARQACLHPNVVRVLNFFRANGTVYMVMEFERGRTLHDYIQQAPRRSVKEAADPRGIRPHAQRLARGAFAQVATPRHQTLQHLPAQRRHPGADRLSAPRARPWSSERPVLKPMYTPGYASPGTIRASRPGPRAVDRHLQRRRLACMPASPAARRRRADERYSKDTLVPAMMRWEGEYSDRLLEIIDWCLNLNHFYRPQSVFALQKALVETVTPPAPKEASSWLNRFVDKYKKAGR
jgi:serine/threonine protein kinase